MGLSRARFAWSSEAQRSDDVARQTATRAIPCVCLADGEAGKGTRMTRLSRFGIPAFIVLWGALTASGAQVQEGAVEQGLTASTMSVYTPPTCVPGVPFSDITCTTGFDPWIEQFGRDGITAGCGGGNYCPGSTVTRDQMAVFIEKAMRGTANWPAHTVLVFHHQAAEAGSNGNSGTELMSMVAAIPSSGAEAPSATNPWLIKLGPGIYDLGSSFVILPRYTALEGAGRDITVITGAGLPGLGGTVNLGDHDKLSRLTVNNSGGDSDEIAVYLLSGAFNVGLEHAAITASNPSNASGAAVGLYADTNTSFSMVDCDVIVHDAFNNYGVEAYSSADVSRLDGVRVTAFNSNAGSSSAASYGFWGSGASPTIINSSFITNGGLNQFGVYAAGGGGPLDLRNSEIYSSGGAANIGVYVSVFATLQGDLIYSASDYGVATNGGGLNADISNCNITGTNWLDNGSGYTVTVSTSKLVGTTTGAGTTNCFGNSSGSAFFANTCP
jgi:hypothetical protein